MINEPIKVKVAASEGNCYAQVIRAAISGMNACSKLHEELYMSLFERALDWATVHYKMTQARDCQAEE